ncbi:MAG: endo-1,4-beta-xylanase [Planctomycetaceae bacterium]
MGFIQFSIDADNLVVASEVSKADFVTFDGRVIAADSTIQNGRLTCIRSRTDSSKLRLLCDLDNRQTVVHSTSLRETQAPYPLELELARGELSRLRNIHALWTGAGLRSNETLNHTIVAAHDAFRVAIFNDKQSSEAAVQAIRHTQAAIALLVTEYTKQRIAFRQLRMPHFPISVGCRLTEPPANADAFMKAFSGVLIKTRWRELEPEDGDYQWDKLDELVDWTTSNGMFCIGGPLLDLSSDCFPEWIAPWKGDLRNLQSFTSDFVETVVSRYVGRIRHWEVVCGPNSGGSNGLSEEDRLNLIVRAIDAAQEVDEQIQISLRIIQPWGEYLSRTDNRLAPIQFVDTLRRSGAKLSEVNLDLRFGTGELHSLQRDMLNVSQLLDHWSMLQLPLNIMAALPETASEALNSSVYELVAWQTELMEQLMLMCLSKERVTGFYCLNWADRTVTDQPLVDPQGNLHPVVRKIAELEQSHWPV